MNINEAYKILGVSVKTPKAEIKKKYLKLAKKYHPDTAKPEFLLKSDINIFMVNEAYSCITNSSNKYNTNIRDINKYSNNTAIYNIFELINNSSDLEFDIFDEDKKKRKK